MALAEEEQQEAREFTHTILLKSGSTGGNKNLFVSSKGALNRSKDSGGQLAGTLANSSSQIGFSMT